MIALVLAALLAADAGTPDAGAPFTPVVLDVAHGALWLHTEDGGVSDAPTLVVEGVYEDTATAIWVGRSKAAARAEAAVGPGVDKQTLLWVGGVMFAVGVLTGGALVAVWKK